MRSFRTKVQYASPYIDLRLAATHLPHCEWEKNFCTALFRPWSRLCQFRCRRLALGCLFICHQDLLAGAASLNGRSSVALRKRRCFSASVRLRLLHLNNSRYAANNISITHVLIPVPKVDGTSTFVNCHDVVLCAHGRAHACFTRSGHGPSVPRHPAPSTPTPTSLIHPDR
jgi:hypothetical protein